MKGAGGTRKGYLACRLSGVPSSIVYSSVFGRERLRYGCVIGRQIGTATEAQPARTTNDSSPQPSQTLNQNSLAFRRLLDRISSEWGLRQVSVKYFNR
jgi:hypothetical protein